ncbi:MAG: drug:proton antiporter [Burkholderiales bacterium]|nr:drug:proton antiporter [Burkholderiales bacterium]
MTHPSTTILYVADPLASARWCGARLGLAPVEASPGFAMFVLPGGLRIGLWKACDVQPTAAAPGGSELTITLATHAEVDVLRARWAAQGLQVLQPPTDMAFGHTVTVADPDRHRLRAFAPHPA